MSDWTVETLKEHMSALLDAQHRDLSHAIENVERTAAAALIAGKEAVSKAEIATEKRLDSMNEFRAALSDQAARFVTRKEMWGYIFGAVAAAAAIVEMMRK